MDLPPPMLPVPMPASVEMSALVVGKAANVAIPLAQAFGVEGADQAAAINDAIQGNGFGKGTQKKVLAAAKKARVSLTV